ncbi:MAG: nucleoside 2-deoxyribosyltransferase [Firmicutes bacterium]|nr:nucleoside 2-deoxyribosyltransferase [Bacillota bacterium]
MKLSIKPEPDFNRIRRSLTLEGRSDRPPLGEFLIAKEIKELVIEHPLQTAADEVEFWVKAGYDYVHVRPDYRFDAIDHRDASIESVGVLRTWEDLRERNWPWRTELDNVDYSLLIDVKKHLPQDMKIILSTGDIFTKAWTHMGYTHFCLSLYEQPELVAELMQQLGHAVYEVNRRAVELAGEAVGAIWYTDDIAFGSGLLVNPEFLRGHLFPWMKKISVLAKQLGVPFLYHTDGNLWEVFDDFVDIGVSAIHPLEPKSMDAEEVKAKRGHQFCLIGNIDVDLLSRGTPEQVRLLVRDRIEKLGYNGGYCVGSSNTVPDYVNPLNFKAMVEAAFEGY